MMLEPEKLQNRGKQLRLARRRETWGTAERLRREAETPEARQERLQHHRAAESLRREAETPEVRQERLQHHRAAEHLRREAETPEARQQRLQHKHILNIRTSSCMHSGDAHGPSHVVLRETVYKQRLLQLAQARPTMPAFTSIKSI